jgi:hypothetical protein
VTAVTRSSGGNCGLTSAGTIACRGPLQPPKCLCDASGGTLTIDFDATKRPSGSVSQQPSGNVTGQQIEGGALTITSLDPVPYLVPSTAKQEQSQKGI